MSRGAGRKVLDLNHMPYPSKCCRTAVRWRFGDRPTGYPTRGEVKSTPGRVASVALALSLAGPDGEKHPSALTQTEGTGNRLSLVRMAAAGWVHTKGLGSSLCSLR